MAHQLPSLPYDYSALEPHIDAQTMQLHHGKHHATYVEKLNQALEKAPEFAAHSIEDLIRDLKKVPKGIRDAVRNHGGGHLNHSIFWPLMKPQGGGQPIGAIADALRRNFGSFEQFRKQFNDAGAAHFGSGWVWLVLTAKGEFKIRTTPNQDNPLTEGEFPIFGNDLWEHAYYLKYQNRRPEYLGAWWNVLAWEAISRRLTEAETFYAPAPRRQKRVA
jgi:Fe-Mn family superoxide dismutase